MLPSPAMASVRTTYWIGGDDGAGWAVSREDHSVRIEADGPGGDLEIFLDPSLFGDLREAMDRAEGRS